MNRRFFIKSQLFLLASTQLFSNSLMAAISRSKSNFRDIYTNRKLKNEFFKFLKNVFNLYPEEALHKLLHEVTLQQKNDQQIYLTAQSKVNELSPLLSAFQYKLPALLRQKDEMARQTVELLGEGTTYQGYLEIGSAGRYLDYLEEKVSIEGKRYYADGKEAGYAITEMIDRGQIFKAAEYIPLADYHTRYADLIPHESLDLVTIYIGFHHCPLELRKPFISSIRDCMRVGGKLILRDHDCDSEAQKTLVALAHDVFNMGTHEAWEYNSKEVRNFYTLDFIIGFIEDLGFQFNKKTLFQDGDPTKNALMVFTKV